MRGTFYPVAFTKQAMEQLQFGVAQVAASMGRHADRTVVFHQQHSLRAFQQFRHVAVTLA